MPALLNQPIDVSADFADPNHHFFLPGDLAQFQLESGAGAIRWKANRLDGGLLFDHYYACYREVPVPDAPELPFSIEFISADTIRVRLKSTVTVRKNPPSLMLVDEVRGGQVPADSSWKREKVADGWLFSSAAGSVLLREKPWGLEIRDASGKVLTKTICDSEFSAFSWVRRQNDYSRGFSAVFSLEPGEKLFGCGESFTGLNKRGQRFLLTTTDPLSSEKAQMYKPVPFFFSSAGYGMFLHTSAPTTFDLGATHTGRSTITTGDDELDLFIFLGTPKEIIGAYTALTGRASMPPLWSFGLWMSRITYDSEMQTREVAAKLRANRIPCDVIHLDTGWFETDWQCDYRFSHSRFDDAEKMIADLKADNFRVSLWQYPYFIPANPLFPEILDKGLAVTDPKGNLPNDDAILDFSNPEAVAWYQEKLAGLLRQGVSAIKTDFGEAAPYNGLYATGRTGFYEHNLYPLRYQAAAVEITKEITGDAIIWARGGWAGAQRNPVHWGGDAHKTFGAMAGSLRAGLSIGLSGFSFWSHDIGGFAGAHDLDVFDAWVPFGMFTSHSRVHGIPPKEPWEFGEEFMNEFRTATEMRYRLMPYIYAQAKDCSERGLPMLRALFVEYPDDPGAWLVEDEYLFGSDILVAPLFEAKITSRDVYLPGGKWIDYQTGKTYSPGWHRIETGPVRALILVRDGAVIPRAALAQSTNELDWTQIELALFSSESTSATGLVCLPSDQKLHAITVEQSGDAFVVKNDPYVGKVAWKIESK